MDTNTDALIRHSPYSDCPASTYRILLAQGWSDLGALTVVNGINWRLLVKETAAHVAAENAVAKRKRGESRKRSVWAWMRKLVGKGKQ